MDQIASIEALLTGDRKYRPLVEGVTDYAIYMLDPEGTVTSWNPGAQHFKGYLASEIIGRHFSAFYMAADRQADVPARPLKAATAAGPFQTEGWRVRKDGSRFWAYVVVDSIRKSSGSIVGFATIIRDLTNQKYAEEALRRSEEQFRLLVDKIQRLSPI
jgi:PAS domain S-box-containing protein